MKKNAKCDFEKKHMSIRRRKRQIKEVKKLKRRR